jgi:hypothetical protein
MCYALFPVLIFSCVNVADVFASRYFTY